MRGVIGFVAGLTVGAVGGFFAAKFALKKSYDKKLETEIGSIKDTANLMAERKAKKKAEQTKTEDTAKPEVKDDDDDFSPKVFVKPIVEIDDYGGEDDDIGEFENDVPSPSRDYYGQLQDILKKEGKPYNIEREEYEDNRNFEKVDVTYDTSREEFVNDRTGELMEDGAILLGYDAGCLDDDRAWPDDGLYYIRNERLSTDYCVSKVAVQ